MRLLLQSHDPAKYKALLKSNPNELYTTVNAPSCERLRDLVIDLISPTFRSKLPVEISLFFPPQVSPDKFPYLISELSKFSNIKFTAINIDRHTFFSGCFPNKLYEEYCEMNCGQQQAVMKALLAHDYVLLLGLPGSGKTSTISFLVRVFIARGEKVLITSYTHSAVDNILEKLKHAGLSKEIIGRLGTPSSIRESVIEYLLESKTLGDIASFRGTVQQFQVIACTVLTASRSMLLQSLPRFDWTVVDECGQISQPATLGSLVLSKKFLLVGDEYQLPPIILSLEAQAKVHSNIVL